MYEGEADAAAKRAMKAIEDLNLTEAASHSLFMGRKNSDP